MRHVFLALFAVLAYTTAMNYEPDREHHVKTTSNPYAGHGYSQHDIRAMNKLIDRETVKTPTRHRQAWTMAGSRAALQGLGWEVAGE